MDRKLIILFIVFFVSVLAMGSVSASDLSNRDFGGYFSMDVPKDIKFQEEINVTNESGIKNVFLAELNDKISVFYMDSQMFGEDSSAWYYQTMFEGMNPDLTRCYESREGNLTILEPEVHNNKNFPLVGTNQGNKIIVVVGEDLDLIKEIGHSIKFK